MKKIIDVESIDAIDWLKRYPNWEFSGKVNTISSKEISNFFNSLYQAGCESIVITDYEWEIEPVYEGDEFHPNMLRIKLPKKEHEREAVFNILNKSYSKLEAKMTYKVSGLETLWYFFEPVPQKIILGNKEIVWYS